MVQRTGIRDTPSRPREVQVTRVCWEVRKAFPEKTPVFLRVSQATTPYFSPKTQKVYLFVKDPQVKLCIFAVAPPRGGRGLKFIWDNRDFKSMESPPLAGGVD